VGYAKGAGSQSVIETQTDSKSLV